MKGVFGSGGHRGARLGWGGWRGAGGPPGTREGEPSGAELGGAGRTPAAKFGAEVWGAGRDSEGAHGAGAPRGAEGPRRLAISETSPVNMEWQWSSARRATAPWKRGWDRASRGHQTRNATLRLAAEPTINPREKYRLEQGALWSDFPTLPNLRLSSRGRTLGSQGATRRLRARLRAAQLVPNCLNPQSDTHQSASPKPFNPRPSPVPSVLFPERAAVRRAPLPVRSAPGHSHGPRGARGRGAAAAAGGEPRSGRVRQGGRCSPRGRAAASGRARVRGGGSCNSGCGGRVCPELWGEGGAGRGRSGAGTASRADAAGTRERTAGGRGEGTRGTGGAHVRGTAFPRPASTAPGPGSSLALPPRYAMYGFTPETPLELPEAHAPS